VALERGETILTGSHEPSLMPINMAGPTGRDDHEALASGLNPVPAPPAESGNVA
jgi:hypothetical protein